MCFSHVASPAILPIKFMISPPIIIILHVYACETRAYVYMDNVLNPLTVACIHMSLGLTTYDGAHHWRRLILPLLAAIGSP